MSITLCNNPQCIPPKPVQLREGKGRPGKFCSDKCRNQAFRGKQPDATKIVDATKMPTLMATQEIKPILKYPGAKWRLARWITDYFPAHEHYVEPFCGSAACFFLKAPSRHEVLNDLNSSIVNLFTVIRERGEDLAALIEMTPWSETEYEQYERDCTHLIL